MRIKHDGRIVYENDWELRWRKRLEDPNVDERFKDQLIDIGKRGCGRRFRDKPDYATVIRRFSDEEERAWRREQAAQKEAARNCPESVVKRALFYPGSQANRGG